MDERTVFAKQLRQLRTAHGLSQPELAEKAGIPQSTVSRYESGETEPGLNALRKLATFFGVSVDTLCGLASPPENLRPGNWLIDVDLVEANKASKKNGRGETWAVAIPERFRIVSSTEYVRIRNELEGKR